MPPDFIRKIGPIVCREQALFERKRTYQGRLPLRGYSILGRDRDVPLSTVLYAAVEESGVS